MHHTTPLGDGCFAHRFRRLSVLWSFQYPRRSNRIRDRHSKPRHNPYKNIHSTLGVPSIVQQTYYCHCTQEKPELSHGSHRPNPAWMRSSRACGRGVCVYSHRDLPWRVYPFTHLTTPNPCSQQKPSPPLHFSSSSVATGLNMCRLHHLKCIQHNLWDDAFIQRSFESIKEFHDIIHIY